MKIGHWRSGVSPAAVLKSGQLNRKRNFKKANPPKADKYRIMNVESSGRQVLKECIQSVLLKGLSEAKPPFEILRFDIRNSAVRCFIHMQVHKVSGSFNPER